MMMMKVVDLGLDIPDTLTFTIVKKVLMVIGELGIGFIPHPLPTTIQVILVDHWGFLFLVMTELDTTSSIFWRSILPYFWTIRRRVFCHDL